MMNEDQDLDGWQDTDVIDRSGEMVRLSRVRRGMVNPIFDTLNLRIKVG